MSSSPECYAVSTGKYLYGEMPLGRREREMDDAARTLQELHSGRSLLPARAGSKRARPASVQDDVRDMLTGHYDCGSAWSETMVRGRAGGAQQLPARAGSRKRVCCSTEMSRTPRISALHPAAGGFGGPGMWDGILN